MSRMLWLWEGEEGAMVCVASDESEAMDQFTSEYPNVDFSIVGGEAILKSFELDEVVIISPPSLRRVTV